MTDTHELDDVWRESLRELADVGDGTHAPERVERRVRSRARRRRTRQSLAAASIALVLAVVAAGVANRDGRATRVPPSSDHRIVAEIHVDTAPSLRLLVVGALPPGASFDSHVLRLREAGRYRFVFGGAAGHAIALDGRSGRPPSTPGEVVERYLGPGRHSLECLAPGHAAAGERLDLVVDGAADTGDVDAFVDVKVGTGHHGVPTLVWTSGPTSVEGNVPVRPGWVVVHWDGAASSPGAQLEFDDAVELAVGESRRVHLDDMEQRRVVAHVGNTALAEGHVAAKVPGVNPPTPAAESVAVSESRSTCGWVSPSQSAPFHTATFAGAAGVYQLDADVAFSIAAGGWHHAVTAHDTVKLDLPLGHYLITCDAGGTIQVIVGK